MNSLKIIILFLWVSCLTSCYTRARVHEISPSKSKLAPMNHKGEVRSFRISGMPQMYIVMMADPGFVSSNSDFFTQEELSKLHLYAKSLNGSVNVSSGAQIIHQGEEKEIDLRKWVTDFKRDGTPIVGDLGKYKDTFAFFNATKGYPLPDCDIIVTVHDPSGLTRTRGLKFSGGFQDSL